MLAKGENERQSVYSGSVERAKDWKYSLSRHRAGKRGEGLRPGNTNSIHDSGKAA
jgi:hypothetical protein